MVHEEFYAKLEALGVAEVRARLVSNGFIGDAPLVRAWLARKDEASNAEQFDLARGAGHDAKRANMIAIIAVVIAAASMIIAIVGIIDLHWSKPH